MKKLLSILFFTILSNYLYAQETTFNQADSLLKTGNFEAYEKNLKHTLSLSIKEKKQDNTLKAYVKLVEYYVSIQQKSDSLIKYHQLGLNYAKKAKKTEYVANFEFQYGTYLTEKGKYIQALKLFQSIENEIQEKDYSFLPHFYDAYARLHYYLKDYENAFVYLKKEAKIFEQRQMPKNIAGVYNNLGILYNSKSQLDSALYYHQKSQKINIQLKDTASIVKSYNNIGQTYQNHMQMNMAKNHFEKALAYPTRFITESFLNNYSGLLIANQSYETAEIFLNSLLHSEQKKIAQSALSQLVTLHKQQRNFEQALAYQEQLNKLSQELLDETKVKEIERLKIAHSTAQKEQEIAALKVISESQQQIIDRNKMLVAIGILLLLICIIVFILWSVNKAKQNKIYQLEMNSKVLHLQMNPHFMFNTLAAIQGNILSNQTKLASRYLVKFSKLLRHHIEQTRSGMVLFEGEIQSLRDYLELQKMRMDNPLQYQITFSEENESDSTDVYVPAMLVQPLVENAIEHGLENIEHPEVQLHFTVFSNYIRCEVLDNGVGYSNTIHQQKTKAKSYATNIIKERLQLYSDEYRLNLNYQVTDRLENNAIVGTVATIEIPILTNAF